MAGMKGLSPIGVLPLDAGYTPESMRDEPSSQFSNPANTWPAAWMENVKDIQLRPESLFRAWEIVRLAQDLTERERRGALLLVLSSIIALEQGSTRLPLDASEKGFLKPLAERIGATADDFGSLEQFLKSFGKERSRPIVG